MAAKPLTAEAIALTEKKMGMTLDDIIKMSKTTNKTKKWQRVSNKSQKPPSNAVKDKALRVRPYMDSQSFVRQGVLAQRRSNIQGNQFPFAAVVAQWAAVAPLQVRVLNGSRVANFSKPRFGVPPVQRRAKNGGFTAKPHHHQQQQQHGGGNVATKQRPHTLDLLFANMKEERTRVVSHQTNGVRRNDGGQQRRPWKRGRFATDGARRIRTSEPILFSFIYLIFSALFLTLVSCFSLLPNKLVLFRSFSMRMYSGFDIGSYYHTLK